MNDRLKSAIATILIHAVLGYVLVVGLAMPIPRDLIDRMTLINLSPERTPLPPKTPPPAPKEASEPIDVSRTTSYVPPPPDGPDWMTMTPMQRLQNVIKTQKFVVAYVKAEQVRMFGWRLVVPQGTGGARVTRVRPPNLATHTVYWPASWSKGLLPIIAWGNGSNYLCFNNSLGYAGFLGEIASHGYFIVAVGNDDIDYPGEHGPTILPDGRSILTKAPALTRGIDWAIAENSRAGSPYQGKLDTSRIAYMGHGCGGGQALDASTADPRTTTTVLLNASGRLRAGPSGTVADTCSATHKASLAHFEGLQDDGDVIAAGDANFARARAAGWPMYKAALVSMGHDEAYPGPDKRWTKAVIAWLDWQLKGDSNAVAIIGDLWRDKWSRIDSTCL